MANLLSFAAKSMKNQCNISGRITMKPKYCQSYIDGVVSHCTHSLDESSGITRNPRGQAPHSLHAIEPLKVSNNIWPQYSPGHFLFTDIDDMMPLIHFVLPGHYTRNGHGLKVVFQIYFDSLAQKICLFIFIPDFCFDIFDRFFDSSGKRQSKKAYPIHTQPQLAVG